ncbi:MAG: 4,5-dihydroxyphthalate decarboxylase [Halanaeroarchaeum sp.]
MTLDISYAGYPYEWTAALWDGRVEPAGTSLSTVNYPNPERFTRMVRHDEFDVCEMSMGTYLASRAADEQFQFTAIPVFPYRKFRHSYMYARPGIETVADLQGGTVGIVNWQTTTGIWQRGILADRHGLDLASIDWYASGSEIVPLGDLEYSIEYLEVGSFDLEERTSIDVLESLLREGKIDAIFHPVPAITDSPDVKRLFDDPIDVETTYYRETSIFPIMHTVVVDDGLIAEHPWIVQSLYDAFEAAKERGLQRLERPRWMPLLWSQLHTERQERLLGEDPWEYGLTQDNETALRTLIRYAAEQGIIDERVPVASIFETETLDPGWFGADS